MGAFTPALTTLTTAMSIANQVSNVASTLSGDTSEDLALKQLKQQQALEEKQLAQQNKLAKEQIALQTAQDEEQRRAALRRAVARQRAQYGASGVSSSGGSSEAVLLGLMNETEDELFRREQLDTLRNKALNQDFTQTKSLNLLQSTQLKERQSLNSLF